MDGWMNGWMIGWTGDLSLKIGGCFCFSQSNLSIVLDWCPMSKCQFLGQHPVCGHTTCTDSSTTMLQQTNKQTNGCTWVDENPQAFLSFFLSSFVLACFRTLNTLLQTLRVSVWWLLAASQAHQPASQPASHGCKIGGSYSAPMAHNWIACRPCLWHPQVETIIIIIIIIITGTGYGYGPTIYQSLLVTGPTTSKVWSQSLSSLSLSLSSFLFTLPKGD